MSNRCTCPSSLSIGDVMGYVATVRAGVIRDITLDGLCLLQTAATQFVPASHQPIGDAGPKTTEELCDAIEAAVPKGAAMDAEVAGISPSLILLVIQLLASVFGGKIKEFIDNLLSSIA